MFKPGEARRLLEEIHQGVYNNHLGGHSLAHKALTTGYYWPYMMTDVKNYVKSMKIVNISPQ